MGQIVINKLSYKNLSKLINLKPILLFLEIKLQKLINIFCLIIYFWVKGSWEFNINIYMKIYLFSEITDKLKFTI